MGGIDLITRPTQHLHIPIHLTQHLHIPIHPTHRIHPYTHPSHTHHTHDIYTQAEKLRSKAQRPETSRSSQQACRYLYYLGRIRAIQLEYTEAKDCLQQAARKVCGWG